MHKKKTIRNLFLFLFLFAVAVQSEDWPMWRYDSGRTAASKEELPDSLQLQWTREYSRREQVWDDPMNNDKMTYDRVFEPVIMGNKIFIGFNDSDKLAAFDLDSGKEIWSFYADGPVRLAPAGYNGKVYFISDDSYLYCLNAGDGSLLWKFQGGPSSQKVIGNKRVISMWPARGGVVVRDKKVYFAASIWPFMGTFIYCIDAETGKVIWVNDSTGAQFIRQPHSAVSFAGVAPQGALAATEKVLLVPGGRSVPAAFERATGRFMYFHLNDGGKGTGGSFVAAGEKEFYVHTSGRRVRHFDLISGREPKIESRNSSGEGLGRKALRRLKSLIKKKYGKLYEPVLDGGRIFISDDDSIREVNRKTATLWKVQADGSGDLIKAGSRLYAAGKDGITVVEVPATRGQPRRVLLSTGIVETIPVKGEVLRLLAGNHMLIAVTLEGKIMAFGKGKGRNTKFTLEKKSLARHKDLTRLAADIIKKAGAARGYALCFGIDDGRLLEEIIHQSELHIIAVDTDPVKVEKFRRKYDRAGIYGKRIAIHLGTPRTFKAPSYIANLIIIGKGIASEYAAGKISKEIYRSVRPYGGGMWYPLNEHSLLARSYKGKIEKVAGGLMIFRRGALKGSDNWTHMYGNIGNTLKSDDSLVKLPLGILWFGGNSHIYVLPRHAHGPAEQVIGGRLFVEGMDSLSARDVYTGRVMWTRRFKNLDTGGLYYTYNFNGDLLKTAYSDQGHFPGANARGANYTATGDTVYMVIGDSCHLLDPVTGNTKKVIKIPGKGGKKRQWGYIGVYKDILLAGAGFADFRSHSITDFSASRGLIAFNRYTGKKLWEVEANYSFYHNGIAAGNNTVFCLDRLPEFAEPYLRRKSRKPSDKYRVAAFDIFSGKLIWEDREKVFGSWLSYSEKHDILFQGGAEASDRAGKLEIDKGMITFQGKSGKVIWEKKDIKYKGPCIIHDDMIITNPDQHGLSVGAYSLLDGSEIKITNPVTGKKESWQIKRGKGCNYILASDNLLTYRDGSASYYDLNSKIGTGSFGGYKSGCSANLVVADGVLNSPDFTRTCVCAYQNQTSLAFIYMPEVETWVHSQYATERSAHGAVIRLGINLGAPGDRMSETGTLWFDWPAVGGPSPSFNIKTEGDRLEYFCRHSSVAGSEKYSWIISSGVRNLRSIIIGLISSPAVKGNRVKDYMKTKGKRKKSRSKNSNDASPSLSNDNTAGHYTVRLYFTEPDNKKPGQRVFDVGIQGRKYIKDFDIVKESGMKWKTVIKEFNNIYLKDNLNLSLSPKGSSETIISGIEIIRENN